VLASIMAWTLAVVFAPIMLVGMLQYLKNARLSRF